MAASDVGLSFAIGRFERLVAGTLCAATAAFEAGGGSERLLIAGFFAATALYVLRPAVGRLRQGVDFAIDFAAVGALAFLCDPAGVLWRAPQRLDQLLALTPVGATVAVTLYLVGVAVAPGASRFAMRAALFALPILFCLLAALGSPVIGELGGALFLGFAVPEQARVVVGRTLVLFLLNEAAIVGAPLALGRYLPQQWRPHGVLSLAALAAALTPEIASLASTSFVASLPGPVAVVAAATLAAVAQAGLWGETYLVTQAMAGMLRGTPSLPVIVFNDWRTGAAKGAVYGLVFMALLLVVGLVVTFPPALAVIAAAGPVGGAIIGAAAYPLARAIVESTDSTPPFFARLEHEYRRIENFPRGAVAGAAVGLALVFGLPDQDGGARFLFGALAGALAYAGVDAGFDLHALMNDRRQHLRSWRVYALGALLGGLVGGAIGWYLDAGQLKTIVDKFYAYIALSYSAEGRPLNAYVIRPLFSKWGATDLGVVDGGVRLFFDESLSGVIQWVFAAPLFSINLFFLTALVRRSLAPLRQLASLEGLDMLIENAVRVLRWGLWMAPVIYSFLKATPDPTWYNQDGLIRTGVAAWMGYALPGQDFRAWSLDIFTALLAYDVVRVVIWFDHMGLRVATLVNLSFVGGDIADEKAARFIGKAQKSRAIPEGLRRFGTWAPLLLPFYIPRGAEWDSAWSAAERMSTLRPPSYAYLFGGYLAYAGLLALALVIFLLVQLARAGKLPLEGITGRGGAPGSKPFELTNGLVSSQWFEDGQGAMRVEGVARGGPPIDLTRRPEDHAHPRGRFLFFREEGGELWSFGSAPTCTRCEKISLESEGCTFLYFLSEQNGFAMEAKISLAPDEAVEITRLRLVDLEQRPRRLTLASLREWVLNETGVEQRDAAYNAIHIGTWYIGALDAIIAQNRLLKGGARHDVDRRLSPEVGFHAIGAGDGTHLRVIGYEDVKARFYGLGPAGAPDSLLDGDAPRDRSDEGLLYGFEPIASLRAELEIPPGGSAEIVIVDGWAKDIRAAARAIEKHLARTGVDFDAVETALARRRALIHPAPPAEHRYRFAEDGRSLTLTPDTPRAYAHVIANAFGQGAVLGNHGDIYSFHGNSRLNALTPFRMGEGRMAPAGQAIYVYDLARQDPHSATFVPLRRRDARYEVEYGLGYAIYRAHRDGLDLELTVFVAPNEPVEYRLLRICNRRDHERLLQIVPMMEMVLAETPNESLGRIEALVGEDKRALYFRNPSNNFVDGWAFVSTSLPAEFAETSRRRFLGHESRDPKLPYMVEHGHPDAGAPEHERKVASFAGTIDAPAEGEALVVVALGQTRSLDASKALALRAREPDYALQELEESRRAWDARLGVLRIKTNRPDFDRMVNDWLPYQLLASRLWGRTGPAQRSGATGYRDQLQDVLPLIHLAPELARAQILKHAAHQFIEGDAVKWWHDAPGGGCGIADRTHASDPHLWLPYLTIRYVAGTGDVAILDAVEPFLEAELTPPDREGHASVPLTSRDKDDLLGHCARAIDFTLDRFGAHGLPLMGAGDWDDGLNLLGAQGRGESVWVGFFLHGILADIAPLFELRGQTERAARYRERAQALRAALDACWRGDRFLRAYADDGREVAPMSAMTASWPVLSGAVDFARGKEALDAALAQLARPDRILLVTPPFDEHSSPYPGRSAEYPPGVRENGGQYSHGVSWLVDALTRLAVDAASRGDTVEAQALFARAFDSWTAISPLSKLATPAQADIYGLPPHQQPADVYEGPGYEGRGGWAWYSGAAARMLSAAYALLGIEMVDGALRLRADAFEAKGELRLERVDFKGERFTV
ncbi:GH36-type glycosyl hydrolase domain-containing protein [Methylosinus sp. Sm6]|uniref:GH36-type glycosyl hydrolase domain-containing protein n=1 Tax=Methylosinus sp. Sm6 TaxID=2866948 RepID=UPI001C991333|nr:glycosyl transferase family 36 [Methylosinus sp. Sm6]MBY6240133.1 glycosyl transferase family 36 [Methylosinus sp. Sm6]